MPTAGRHQHSLAKPVAQQQAAETAQRSSGVDSIHKACAYGDFDALRRYAEQQPELVNQVRQGERNTET